MDIAKAKLLTVGAHVHCPADRGEPAFTGKVKHVGQNVSRNIHGAEYLWITVRKPGAHASVWPSNRLG